MRDDRPTLLIVEDDPETRRVELEIFSRAGYRCVGAGDAEAALELAIKAGVSAALVDISLPGMNGAELAWRLRQEMPGVPIVVVSGYVQDWDIDDLKDLGIFKAISKPFEPQELLEAVGEALAQSADDSAGGEHRG